MSSNPNEPKWAELLGDLVNGEALSDPAFSLFHQYSLGNQMWAMWQMRAGGHPVQPVGTLKFWNKQGRRVIKGQKASVWMLVPRKVIRPHPDKPDEKISVLTGFDEKRWWFRLDQTEGDEYEHVGPKGYRVDVDSWDFGKLDVKLVPFEMFEGNVLGYAKAGVGSNVCHVAVNPLVSRGSERYMLVLAHELAHCLLHINEDTREMIDHETLSRNVKEGEAEATAFLVASAVKGNTEGREMAYSRDYVRHWHSGGLTDKMAERVVWAAGKILGVMKDEQSCC